MPLGQGKFSSQVHKEPKDTLEFVLLVDNVQEADVGAYTCQLHSWKRSTKLGLTARKVS